MLIPSCTRTIPWCSDSGLGASIGSILAGAVAGMSKDICGETLAAGSVSDTGSGAEEGTFPIPTGEERLESAAHQR